MAGRFCASVPAKAHVRAATGPLLGVFPAALGAGRWTLASWDRGPPCRRGARSRRRARRERPRAERHGHTARNHVRRIRRVRCVRLGAGSQARSFASGQRPPEATQRRRRTVHGVDHVTHGSRLAARGARRGVCMSAMSCMSQSAARPRAAGCSAGLLPIAHCVLREVDASAGRRTTGRRAAGPPTHARTYVPMCIRDVQPASRQRLSVQASPRCRMPVLGRAPSETAVRERASLE